MSDPVCVRCGWPILDDQQRIVVPPNTNTLGVGPRTYHLECPKMTTDGIVEQIKTKLKAEPYDHYDGPDFPPW